ncbi:methyltransferase domain-containing protein [Ignavibacteria bacterium]|nr:class I SAM-dependent methyltransferase [Bacteroidota bacterium]MCZ2133524.1 class I SAM-dependent methyltransferase [Bacteroidota bacterium]
MSNQTLNVEQGHWILAKMGKKVLRPGGKELTTKLINNLNIISSDNIVEFAPGLGYTASLALQRNPKSYTGIELNEEAASILRKTVKGENRKIVVANAANSTLVGNSADKVYGEAMLTMHADHRKSEIMREAYRILKKGALYGIHELGLTPDNLDQEIKSTIQKELAQVIKVNARPLTVSEWTALLEKEGFRVLKVETNPMSLLEIKRIIDDEGIFRTLKITFNILRHRKERKRIVAMRDTFRKYQKHLNAVAIVAEKI